MLILAIDPGTTHSAWLAWDGSRIPAFGIFENHELRELRHGHFDGAVPRFVHNRQPSPDTELVIERIMAHGMATGATTLLTCEWTGRFAEAWEFRTGRPAHWLPRVEVKKALCHSGAAKDPHVRQALIDRLGPPGTKKAPGVTYGISKDVWAALAVAVAFGDLQRAKGVA